MLTTDDDPAARNAARARLRLRRPKRKARSASTQTIDVAHTLSTDDYPVSPILLSADPHASVGVEYRWAVLYENQRGMTVFDIPIYSGQSLLPFDPYPFTIPSIPQSRKHQPNVSLSNYPLPDGTWSWVSKAWMIDMRTDTGQVQHDGFEYNWVFRSKHWSPIIGRFNAWGWVRRRRWIRLMIRTTSNLSPALLLPESAVEPPSAWNEVYGSTQPTDDIIEDSEFEPDQIASVWQGIPEDDWNRYRALVRSLSRDGKQLELWQQWLAVSPPRSARVQWTEDGDVDPLPNVSSRSSRQFAEAVPIAYIIPVLREHLEDVLRSFIYPDSRAAFVSLVERAGISSEITLTPESKELLEFASYSIP